MLETRNATGSRQRGRGYRVVSRFFSGVLVGVLLLLVACGGEDEAPEVATPEVTATTVAATPTASPTASPTATATQTTYTVEAGDTGLAIALEFGISLAELAEANGMTEAELDQLQIGQELAIPSPAP